VHRLGHASCSQIVAIRQQEGPFVAEAIAAALHCQLRKGVPWPYPSSVAGGLLFFVSLTGSVLNLRCRALLRNLTAHGAFQKGKVPDPADLFLVRLAFDELHVMYAANWRCLPLLYETHLSHPRHSKHESPLFPRGLCQIKRERLLCRESSAEPLRQAVQNSSQSVSDLITSLDHPAHSMIALPLAWVIG
jgi:hypothetical protein